MGVIGAEARCWAENTRQLGHSFVGSPADGTTWYKLVSPRLPAPSLQLHRGLVSFQVKSVSFHPWKLFSFFFFFFFLVLLRFLLLRVVPASALCRITAGLLISKLLFRPLCIFLSFLSHVQRFCLGLSFLMNVFAYVIIICFFRNSRLDTTQQHLVGPNLLCFMCVLCVFHVCDQSGSGCRVSPSSSHLLPFIVITLTGLSGV